MTAHLLAAHLSVVLALVGAGADLLGAALRRGAVRRWAATLLGLAAAGAVVALLTGALARSALGAQLVDPDGWVERHAFAGAVGAAAIAGAGALRARLERSRPDRSGALGAAASVFAAAVALAVWFTGVSIRHGVP